MHYVNQILNLAGRAPSVTWLGLVLILLLAACGTTQVPGLEEQAQLDRFDRIAAIDVAPDANRGQIERNHDGKVVVWRPEAGFAILGFKNKNNQGHLQAQELLGEANEDRFHPPEVSASGWTAWSGGWTAWSGGWTAWSGGWTAWSGGSETPTTFGENLAIWDQIDLPEAQQLAPALGAGVKVAVIDTGIDLTHLAFAGKLAPASEWRDYVDNDDYPMDEPGGESHGHGTGVAGVIVQVAPNATILPIRVLEPDGSGDVDAVVSAIDHAVSVGAQIINLSLGSADDSDSLKTMLEYATKLGIYIIASAGNDGVKDGLTEPGRRALNGGDLGKRLLSVGSVSAVDIKSEFSNYGNGLEVLAPGESVHTLAPAGQITHWSGTSFAAPVTSGALALALGEGVSTSYLNDLGKYVGDNTDEIKNLSGNSSWSGDLGKGRLNVASFLRGTEIVDYHDPFMIYSEQIWDLEFAYATSDVKIRIYPATSDYNHEYIVADSVELAGDSGTAVVPYQVNYHSDYVELVLKEQNPELLGLFADPNIAPGTSSPLTVRFALQGGAVQDYPLSVPFEDSDLNWVDYDGTFTVEVRDAWKLSFATDTGGDVRFRIHDTNGGYNSLHINPDSVVLRSSLGEVRPTDVKIDADYAEIKFHEQKPELFALLAAPTLGSSHTLTMDFTIGDGAARSIPVTIVVVQ